MRTEKTYYGDYKVSDEMPFTGSDILKATYKIRRDFGELVWKWPIDVEWNETCMWWVLTFTRPVSDDQYVKHMEDVDGLP